MKYTLAPLAVAAATAFALPAVAETQEQQAETIRKLEQRIQQLESTLDERVEFLADAIERQQSESVASRVNFGGYGEMNYSNLNVDGEDTREMDFRRWVLFVGYEFNDWVSLHSEFEVEHTVVPASDGAGAIELEQAYLEFKLADDKQLKTGIQLMPVGIVNETHEPVFYYGVERPVLETTLIPSTWFAGGVMYSQQFSNGFSYDLFISEGLQTEDPTTDSDADPFDIKSGKQKTHYANMFDLATTARIKYTGIAGLELSAYGQYQPDLDQSAEDSYADSATMLGAHAVYQLDSVTGKVMVVRWDLAGDAAAEAGKDVQQGAQFELSWKALEQLAVFGRQTNWSEEDGVDASQTNLGLNYYPISDVVFKFDYQLQNEDAGNTDGFYLGMGYQF